MKPGRRRNAVSNYVQGETETRPWGDWTVLALGPRYVVKRIRVAPGAAISLQRHQWRDEHWVVVNGVADIFHCGGTRQLSENEAVFIPAGELHRMSNAGKGDLVIIEVQHGERLDEGDIERLEDSYGRAGW